MNGVFVTGTDTGLGKTIVCAALITALRRSTPIKYWKPIQTGTENDDDTSTVQGLCDLAPDETCGSGYRLRHPWSPHRSARFAGIKISMDEIKTIARANDEGDRFWIVEGAGGVLVPLNDTDMMIDLIAALSMPVVVVARPTVGTINHTLLTLEALRSRGIAVAGVIINRGLNKSNADAIRKHGNVPVIGELVEFGDPLKDELRLWSDYHHECLIDRLLPSLIDPR